MRRLLRLLWLASALAAWVVRAEGVSAREKIPATEARIHGATSVQPLPNGGLVNLGGTSLRYLAPGARQWEVLHTQPGDSLYRVASDSAGGRILASWEKEPVFHLFTLSPRGHLTFPKPTTKAPNANEPIVDHLAFAPNGRDAVVFIHVRVTEYRQGKWFGSQWAHAAYHVALDGRSPARLLFHTDGVYPLHASARGAVYATLKNPYQRCDTQGCYPITSIVAYELTENGATKRTLLDAGNNPFGSALPVFGGSDGRVGVLLAVHPRGRALLRWRFGEAKAVHHALADSMHLYGNGQDSMLTPSGEYVELRTQDRSRYELSRLALDGTERRTTLLPPAERNRHGFADSTVYDMGVRQGGGLWVHWGDQLLLVDHGRPVRGVNLEPLVPRQAEWAGVGIYVSAPESLWMGMELGRGRDFRLVRFDDVERRAKPWPTAPGR